MLAAEVVYEATCVLPLLSCMHELSSEDSLVLLFHTERNVEASTEFWRAVPEFFRAELLEPPAGGTDQGEVAAAVDAAAGSVEGRGYVDGLFRLHRLPRPPKT